MKNHILAVTLAASAMSTQASDVFQKEQIRLDDPRITAMCKQFQNKTGMLLDGKEVCEYSIDNGKSWTTVTDVALGVAALLGLGASSYGLIRLRRKRKGDWEVAKRDTTISDAQREAHETNEGEVVYTVFNPDKQDALLKRVSGFIQNRQYKPAETQLNMTLGSHPERTDLYIKKLELYFAQGDVEQFEATYLFIINTIDPLKKLIPSYIHELMKDWGREIDSTNSLYAKSETDDELLSFTNSSQNTEGFQTEYGTEFNSIYKGGENIAMAHSDGGREYMEDYVHYIENDNGVIMIVLDGVSSGKKGATEEFVKNIGTHLESNSLEEIVSQTEFTDTFPLNVATTAGKVIIKNNVLTFEKVGDVGILIFDKDGNVTLQDIGGGYVPDSWFGSSEMVDLIEGQDIVNDIRNNGFTVPGFMEDMTKGEFMKTYGIYTKQIGEASMNANVVQHEYALQEGDVVVLATDGVFDNMSGQQIIDTISSESSIVEGTTRILSTLNDLSATNLSGFGGSYKTDNIGISIYRHSLNQESTTDTTEEAAVIETAGVDLAGTQNNDTSIEEAREVTIETLDMKVVKNELQEYQLTADEIIELKKEIDTRTKDAKFVTRLITHTIGRYGFDVSEDGDNITLSTGKNESVLYYLNQGGEVETKTKLSIAGVAKLSTLGKGYIEVITKPEYKKLKILLTTSDNE